MGEKSPHLERNLRVALTALVGAVDPLRKKEALHIQLQFVTPGVGYF